MKLQRMYSHLKTLGMVLFHLCMSTIPCFQAFGLTVRLCSLQSISGPLIGYYHTTTLLCLLYISKAAIAFLCKHTFSWYALLSVYHIPTVCGALYCQYIGNQTTTPWKQRIALALIPFVCTVWFMVQTQGSSAWLYTLPWLIPTCSALIHHRSVFIHSLASTLIMHSIGSVMWLETHTTTPEFWLALIPLACVERIILALGMTGTVYTITYFKHIASVATTPYNTITLQAQRS